MDFGVAIGYGTDKPDFWIGEQPAEGPASGPNREVHLAFSAPDAGGGPGVLRGRHRAGRRGAARAAACGRSTTSTTTAAFVRDPDGNNVEAVCHTAGPATDRPGRRYSPVERQGRRRRAAT